MADVKWIKIVTDIFDDEKILLIEALPERDSIIVIWFKLLCMAGKQNNSGVFMLNERIAYTDEMLATIFRRPLNTVRLALQTFEQFGMIVIVNDAITIPNWNKHQNLEGIQARKEYMREYMKDYRKKQAQIACHEDSESEEIDEINRKHLRKQHVSILEEEEEGEEEREGDKEREKKKTAKRFTPPTVAEVRAYCQERKNNVDAERFVDYYTANGWKVGKNPMKDWKAAVRTWEKHGWNGYGYGGKQQPPQQPQRVVDENESIARTKSLIENLNIYE